MKTYEDLLRSSGNITDFILSAINEHKASRLYTEAETAYEYYKKRNITINEYKKLLYTLTGEAVPDNFSANYKFVNSFFPIFVRQEAAHLVGNGVNFNNEQTKEKLGGNKFDIEVFKAAKAALWGGVSFGFYNLDHLDVFTILEFVPLIGEEDGALHAGIRFWQIDSDKPLRATLYEEDGYTDYIWQDGIANVLKEKTNYILNIISTPADGIEILDGQNYPSFPIVPLWGNEEHQSEFTGLREKIDGYDLIQSGLANDLDEASYLYWSITNAGGMDDLDLAKFVERMKTVKAAVVDEGGSHAEAHTMDVPYMARLQSLEAIRDSLYRDAMALDTDKISAGNITATAIEASYENLTLKCDDFEICMTEFINGILALAGLEDAPTYKRSKIINMPEISNMILAAAQYLDDETVLKHLPFLSPDEIADIMKRKDDEEQRRFEQFSEEGEIDAEGEGQSEEGDGEAPDRA